MSKKKLNWFLIILALFIGAGGMYLLIYNYPIYAEGQTIVNKSEKEVTVTDKGIADAVEKLYDAVVMIYSYKNDKIYTSGTGFVYKTKNKSAYILTNNHVIESADKVTVTFSNGAEEEVKVIGKDQYYDLAVLTLDATKIISVAEIGNSEALRLGDTLFTIGAPLDSDYFGTVTRGIVSGKNRELEVSTTSSSTTDYIVRVIQTDASINSGNSGGPLANSNGEVVGITSMKLVKSGVEGMGFAIPIEDAMEFASVIESGKQIERPLLGVSMYDVANAGNFGYGSINIDNSLTKGVVVAEVQKNSPAAKGGIEQYDVITKINEKEVKNVATLKYYLYKCMINDTITLTVNRQGKTKTIKVKLTEKAN